MEDIFLDAYVKSMEKIKRNSESIGVKFPHVAIEENGNYNNERVGFWTGGFWCGLLWLNYRETYDPKIFEIANEIETIQDTVLDDFEQLHHDVGFMWLPTAVEHYKHTNSAISRKRALKATSVLASRFNLAGKFIRAWNGDRRIGWGIIDCMMNLSLLYWASKETKDPRFKQIAEAHAKTAQKAFIRDDYSVVHVVSFDYNNGNKIENMQGQGKSPESSWSRGQAWAIYGFAISYRETGNADFIDTAKKVADRYMERLPKDKIAYWDFDTDEKDKFAKDTSSMSIAASGMLEIAKLCSNNEEKNKYINEAKTLLKVLIEKCACFDDSTQGIIKMGTVNYTNNKYVNVPIIYGDFYFVEALGKLKGLNGIF